MTQQFQPALVEPKWQERWEQEGLYRPNLLSEETQYNYYNLLMLADPADDVHVGHLFGYTGSDVAARYKRAHGHNVFFPFGVNSFALTTEKEAAEHGLHPHQWVETNIECMTQQIRRLGTMIDWSDTLATHRPDYYKWNQWFFLKLLERGVVHRELGSVDWCPVCHTTLGHEQVKGEDHVCEQCTTPVIKKNLYHWKIRTSDYAEELLRDLAKVDWPDNIKTAQRDWIGRSRGVNIRFPVQGLKEEIEVFTTRPETAFGATFLVLAPHHRLLDKVTASSHRESVEQFRRQSSHEIRRLSPEKEKTGVFTGGYAINPLTKELIPIWIADYVLLDYGTGAIMGVPAGDQRDLEFARKYNLPVRRVVVPLNGDETAAVTEAYTEPGFMINSAAINGLFTLGRYVREEWGDEQIKVYGFALKKDEAEAKEVIIEYLKDEGIGEPTMLYRLQDWVISRQRHWGCPIPIVYCQSCGQVPVPIDQLPVQLPADFGSLSTEPLSLKSHDGFRDAACPRCGRDAERECDTMDPSIDSSWYFYRHLNPHLDDAVVDSSLVRKWLPVTHYTGATEYAVTHLLYARIWTKLMRDLGLIDLNEPFARLLKEGVILGPDSRKMSKRRGNVVGSEKLLQEHGADILRGHLMFIGPWVQGGPFSLAGIEGIRRFYNRVWDLSTDRVDEISDTPEIVDLESIVHQTIERVQNAYEVFSFNLVLAALMEMSNTLRDVRSQIVTTSAWDEAVETLLIMMAPIAPHMTEELWEQRGHASSIHRQPWPLFDQQKATKATFELVIQFNGKVRDRVQAPVEIDEVAARRLALQSKIILQLLNGREPRKVVYVPRRLVNVVG